MLKRAIYGAGIFLLIIVIIYALGPTPDFQPVNYAPLSTVIEQDIEDYVAQQEKSVKDLKQGNEAKIVWADTSRSKTPYVLLYLHGFSASHEEGAPLHTDIGEQFGMNVFLSRLYDHGRQDTNTFKGLTPALLYESAVNAMQIANQLGDSVIIFSVSTGSTLAVMLDQTYDNIAAHIMYSPNFAIADPSSVLVNNPWGKSLLEIVMSGEYNRIPYPEHAKQYWNAVYHIDGIVALQSLIEDNMTNENFKEISAPLLLGCYYKDEEHQDNVVSVEAMRGFFDQISTPKSKKQFVEYPNVPGHVFTSQVFVEDLSDVRLNIFQFLDEKLGLEPAN